ncbi:MAG: NUDIX domain-containing protein [Candidatus Liptonbacteria bacterium]|nr:NUDIX domain-containing protein [Candidatus Liptonbacteria bacterium]
MEPNPPAGGQKPKSPMDKEVSAGIIIFRRTGEGPKFLLLYMGGAYWNFPKGKLEREERALEAAFREIHEETSIFKQNLRLLRGFSVYDKYVYTRNRRKIAKTVIFYLAETRRKEIRLPVRSGPGETHEGYAWVRYAEGMKMLNHENLRRNLKRAYDFIRHARRPHAPAGQPVEKQNPPAGGGGARGEGAVASGQ